MFRLAEEAKDMFAGAGAPYANWKDFEIDLAQLCQLIMVFCESEGSIAEFATFSDIDEIARRLLLIIDDKNYSEGSYIKLGLINSFEQRYTRKAVYVLQYRGLNIEHGAPVGGIDLDEFRARMGRVVPGAVQAHHEPRTFDAGRPGHIIKLITGLAQHFGAMTLDEISVYLWAMGLPEKDERLRQLIECAKFLRWIVEVERGRETYYVAAQSKDAVNHGGGAAHPPISKAAWRALVREYWQKHEPDRIESIRQVAAVAL